MLFILLFKQVISISQYNDHMILNQNEKYVIPSAYYKYNNNTNTDYIIQENKYILLEHQLDIGKFVYGKLNKNQLWLLGSKNGKFDLYVIKLPIDIMRIKFQISIEQTNCYKIDIFQDDSIIVFCFNECFNFYNVYNWKLRKLKLYKFRREKCNVETYDSIILDENYIIIQYDNFIEVLDHKFVKQCQMEFKHNIKQIYYKDNLYIYTSQSNHEVSEQTICNFKETSYTLHSFVIIGNKYQIFMDSQNKININGISYKINVNNLFFNDKYLIFQSVNTYYVYNYDIQKLITGFEGNKNSKIFVNIELLDIYIVNENTLKLINFQEEAYQLINSQQSLEVTFKEQLYLFLRQHNQTSIIQSQLYLDKVVISQNQTQIRMGPFDGGNLSYKFKQMNNQDQILINVNVVNYKLRYQQDCIFFQIYTCNKHNLFICQHYNLTITIYKSLHTPYDIFQSYHIDEMLTKNDIIIILDTQNNIIQQFILRVANDHFKLFTITALTLNIIFSNAFDKLIVFDANYVYYEKHGIIYRYVISLQIIEMVKLYTTKLFIDQQNYIVYDSPYLNYYCQNNQHSQQFHVGSDVIDIKSFHYSITVIQKGQIQIYHRLNQHKILYIGDLDLYDNEIDDTCQFISDKELLYVRCHNRLIIFDTQQSLKQSLMKNFITPHSFPLISASKLNICFEESPNKISCYFIYQLFEFTYQFIQKIHNVKVDLQIIAFNKYNQESIHQVILIQNNFQDKGDHFIKYQAFRGQTKFKIDIEQNDIRQQNYLCSDFYELTRSVLSHQSIAIKSLNFIVIIQNDDFKVYENDYVANQLQFKAIHISVIYDNILYYQRNQSLQFYECDINLNCNQTQLLDLLDRTQFRVLQFGNRIVIQQSNTLNIYAYEREQKQMKKILQIDRIFQVYDIYEDIIVYLQDKKLIIYQQSLIYEHDLQNLIEMEDLVKINQLVIINDLIDILISDGYKILIYRFSANQQPQLRAVLFKEYLFGQRQQFYNLQMKNGLIMALNYQTQINFYNYQDIDEVQYLYPIKIIYSPSGFVQIKGMQLFIIKEQIVVVYKLGMEIKIIHLQLEQYLVIETGVFQSQITLVKCNNQAQTIIVDIEIQETDYYLVIIIFLIIIFVYIKYLQIKT